MQSLPYDFVTASRLSGELISASMRIFSQLPGLGYYPGFRLIGSAGEVYERAFSSMSRRPSWSLDPVTFEGRACAVRPHSLESKPFGDLVQFCVEDRPPMQHAVFLVAPMSGHYATLLREQVSTLLPFVDVYITDWHNARDVAVSNGRFGLDEYVQYLEDWISDFEREVHVVAVCQPVPLTIAAVSRLIIAGKGDGVKSVTLMGGPVDPDAAPTQVTDFGSRVSMRHLEGVIQAVGSGHVGSGRLVYPGSTQLASFVSMNPDKHFRAFGERIYSLAFDESPNEGHNRFYDEYLAVMDMPAEFYLETVEEIFQKRGLASGEFAIMGERVDLSSLADLSIAVVEGGRDDICAPGQCSAIFDLVPGDGRRLNILAPNSGHYGIFGGKGWRSVALPQLLEFWQE